jgi:hypothetical protein
VPVESDGSLLAVFQGTQLRGVDPIMAGPGGKVFQLTVMSDAEAETGLTLKVYDKAAGTVSDVAETLDFAVNGAVVLRGRVSSLAAAGEWAEAERQLDARRGGRSRSRRKAG